MTEPQRTSVPVGASGRWRIEHFEIPEPPDGYVDTRPAWARDAPGTYTSLLCDDVLFMSDLHVEIHTQAPAIERARQVGGRILITGLGLGLVVDAILAAPAPAVTEIVIVEHSSDVASLVAPYLAERHGDLVRVVIADARTYRPGPDERFSVGWHDIWASPQDPVAARESAEMIEHYAPWCDWQGSWSVVFMDAVESAHQPPG